MTSVSQLLAAAASQQIDALHNAEHQLAQLESVVGFYSSLAETFVNRHEPPEVRFMAIVYLKNGIDRYWKSTKQGGLVEQDKLTIKRLLMSVFDEPVNQLATQHALTMAKIARQDFPDGWPDLIPTLVQYLSTSDSLLLRRRLLQTLHQVAKALSSKRLPADRKVFTALSEALLPHLWHLYKVHLTRLCEDMRQNDLITAYAHTELTILCVKVLRRIIVFGLKKLDDAVEVQSFVDHDLTVALSRLCGQFGKATTELHELSPLTFVPFLESYLSFILPRICGNYLACTPESFFIRAMTFLKNIIRCAEYNSEFYNVLVVDALKHFAMMGEQIVSTVFTTDRAAELLQALVTKYFIMTDEDIEIWASDPESCVVEEVGEAWRFKVRPCAEELYLAMMTRFKSTLAPVVAQMLHAVQGSPLNLDQVRLKEAVFNAVSIAANDLYDFIDFASWFATSLRNELFTKEAEFAIVRRRALLVLGSWVGIKFAPEARCLLYETLLAVMQDDTDVLVRLQAAKTLGCAVDDFDFRTAEFSPYLPGAIQQLARLLREVSECDTKLTVLTVLTLIVERVGSEVAKYVAVFGETLPQLWAESEQHNLLRCGIIAALAQLVKGIGQDSMNIHDFLLPIIDLGTDVNQSAHVYLMDEALDLWLFTVRNSTTLTDPLLRLFEHVVIALDQGIERLTICFKILHSYILFGSEMLLKVYGKVLVERLSVLMGVNEESQQSVLHFVDVTFQVYGPRAAELMQPLLERVFDMLFNMEENRPVVGTIFSLLARLLLQADASLLQFVSALEQHTQSPILATWIDLWVNNLNSVGQPSLRKVNILGMMKLLQNSSQLVTDTWSAILETICDVSLESNIDFVLSRDDEESEEVDLASWSPDRRRERNLMKIDPVFTLSIPVALNSAVQAAIHADAALFQYRMSQVDASVAARFTSLCKL